MTITRYGLGREYAGNTGSPAITEQADGAYVSHADHLSLINELQAELVGVERIAAAQTVTIAELRGNHTETPNSSYDTTDHKVSGREIASGEYEAVNVPANAQSGAPAHDLQRAVEAYQIAEQACAQLHSDAGNLIEPGIAVEAGLIAAAPFLATPPADGREE